MATLSLLIEIFYRAMWRTGLFRILEAFNFATNLSVIPGRREAPGPESRAKLAICLWIPGSRP
jgi:hypothetical protein